MCSVYSGASSGTSGTSGPVYPGIVTKSSYLGAAISDCTRQFFKGKPGLSLICQEAGTVAAASSEPQRQSNKEKNIGIFIIYKQYNHQPTAVEHIKIRDIGQQGEQ